MSGDLYTFSDKFLSVNSIANIENAVNLVSRTKPEYLIINHLLEDKKRVDHFRVSSDLIEYLNIVYGLVLVLLFLLTLVLLYLWR